MPGTSSLAGGVSHTSLTAHERHAAQQVLDKLKHGTGSGLQLSGVMASATVSSGSAHSQLMSKTGLGASTLIHGYGNDTFMGGVRSSSPVMAAHIGNDTVVSGSSVGSRSGTDSMGARGAQHFALSSDTVNIAGATAAGMQAAEHKDTTRGHTVSLGEKTTVTIAGLSAHDITKLHH